MRGVLFPRVIHSRPLLPPRHEAKALLDQIKVTPFANMHPFCPSVHRQYNLSYGYTALQGMFANLLGPMHASNWLQREGARAARLIVPLLAASAKAVDHSTILPKSV